MPTEIRMPQLGESVTEGTLGKWLKRPGEPVAKYEPLVEVITDKVNVEMPSPYAGVLTEILVQEGQTVTAGTVIARVQEQHARGTSPAPAAPSPPGASSARGGAAGQVPTASLPLPGGPSSRSGEGGRPAAPVRPSSPDGEGAAGRSPARARESAARLSPLVRRLAEEHRIRPEELEAIEGTGAGGRITKEDVLHYLERRGTAPSGAASTSPTAGPERAALGSAAPGAGPRAPIPVSAEAPTRRPGDQLHPLSAVRRTIADRMARSAREIPHAYGIIEVDVTGLVRHRDTHKAAWREREGVNVSFTAFIVRAATQALRAWPAVNSTFTPDGILYRQAINFGIGVAIPDGLIVPVIKDADQKSVVGLAREIEALAGRARQGKLTLDDVSGGTFTLTNPGVFGSIFSMPLINYPQAAILATDAIVRRPVVVGEGIAIREIMHLGLAFDHRIFDGAVGMQFLTHIKRQLEEFAPLGDSPEF